MCRALKQRVFAEESVFIRRCESFLRRWVPQDTVPSLEMNGSLDHVLDQACNSWQAVFVGACVCVCARFLRHRTKMIKNCSSSRTRKIKHEIALRWGSLETNAEHQSSCTDRASMFLPLSNMITFALAALQ